MFSLGWLIGVGIVAGLAGAGFGVWYNQRSGASKRVIELEEQLSSSQQAHEEYRQEVFDQFSDTAAKFQTLNESYVDLHEQLAKSANALCGDMAGSLLEGSLVSALTDESDEDAVSDVVDDQQTPDAEEEIIVAEAPSLDEVIGPLEEDDVPAPPDVFAAETATAAPEADDDAKVREVG